MRVECVGHSSWGGFILLGSKTKLTKFQNQAILLL